MNSKQQSILERIFKDPVQSDIEWKDIENLFKALGAEITEGNGSRIRVKLNDQRAVFHHPHPERVTDKGAVKSVRQFLTNGGVKL